MGHSKTLFTMSKEELVSSMPLKWKKKNLEVSTTNQRPCLLQPKTMPAAVTSTLNQKRKKRKKNPQRKKNPKKNPRMATLTNRSFTDLLFSFPKVWVGIFAET